MKGWKLSKSFSTESSTTSDSLLVGPWIEGTSLFYLSIASFSRMQDLWNRWPHLNMRKDFIFGACCLPIPPSPSASPDGKLTLMAWFASFFPLKLKVKMLEFKILVQVFCCSFCTPMFSLNLISFSYSIKF